MPEPQRREGRVVFLGQIMRARNPTTFGSHKPLISIRVEELHQRDHRDRHRQLPQLSLKSAMGLFLRTNACPTIENLSFFLSFFLCIFLC